MKANYSRASFVEQKAPRNQKCSCQCGENIKRGDTIFARPFVDKGRVTGTTRIINMDHYDNWLENVGHAYAKRIIRRHPELEEYFK